MTLDRDNFKPTTEQPSLFPDESEFLKLPFEDEVPRMSRLPELPDRSKIQINPEIRLDFLLSALIALMMGGYFMFRTGTVYENRQATLELKIKMLEDDQRRQDADAKDKSDRIWTKLDKLDEKMDKLPDLLRRNR